MHDSLPQRVQKERAQQCRAFVRQATTSAPLRFGQVSARGPFLLGGKCNADGTARRDSRWGSELVPVVDIASAGTCGTSGPRGGQPGRKCGWLVCFLDDNAPPQLISIAQALRSVVVETRPTVPATAWLQRRWPGSEERW